MYKFNFVFCQPNAGKLKPADKQLTYLLDISEHFLSFTSSLGTNGLEYKCRILLRGHIVSFGLFVGFADKIIERAQLYTLTPTL